MFSIRNFRIHKITATSGIIQRFKGHSKWQNIRHTKAAKDSERAQQTTLLLNDVRKAVLSAGGVTDPTKNHQLQVCVTAALQSNVNKETLTNFLKRLETSKEVTLDYYMRGPEGSIVFMTFSCIPASVAYTKERIKRVLKNSCLTSSPALNGCFETKGIIVAKHPTKSTMDDAEEAAILSGAEDVSLEEDEINTFRFGTESESLWPVVKHLRGEGWEILESSVEMFPLKTVNLSETNLNNVEEVIRSLQELPEFLNMVHNMD